MCQAMQEKKALSSRGRGRLRGFLELRRPWGFSPEGNVWWSQPKRTKAPPYQEVRKVIEHFKGLNS